MIPFPKSFVKGKNNFFHKGLLYLNLVSILEEQLMLRLLIFGCPGTPILELGDKLSQFYKLEYYSIQKVPDNKDSYFDDKIPAVLFDTGDFTAGSESQHMVRDPSTMFLERELSLADASIPGFPGYEMELNPQEHCLIDQIDQGIVAMDIPDMFLVDWATHVLFLESNEKAVINWFSKRSKCFTCGAVFHAIERPNKVRGKCDRCGSKLERQEQDEPHLIREQFKGWRNSFWKFEEVAKKHREYKTIVIDNLRDFDDIASTANLWIRNKITQKDCWYI